MVYSLQLYVLRPNLVHLLTVKALLKIIVSLPLMYVTSIRGMKLMHYHKLTRVLSSDSGSTGLGRNMSVYCTSTELEVLYHASVLVHFRSNSVLTMNRVLCIGDLAQLAPSRNCDCDGHSRPGGPGGQGGGGVHLCEGCSLSNGRAKSLL